MSRRCVVVIPDAGPFNSLWVAGRLDLLLLLDMPIVIVDAVYDEMTSDPKHYPKDCDVKRFVDSHPEVFTIEMTDIGQEQRLRRANGLKLKKNAGDVAIADFMTDGLERYANRLEPVLVLYEDSDIPGVRFFRKPPNVHLLSTVGLLRGLQKVGLLDNVDTVVHAMTHPANPAMARALSDLPDGTDEPAAIGSLWTPPKADDQD